MKYIHVKNLEKYQPGYKDRRHIWAKIYFDLISGGEDSEDLSEIALGRLVRFIVMETCRQKPTRYDEKFLAKRNFDFKIQPLKQTVKELSHFIEIIDVTEIDDSCNETVTEPYPREEKNREEKRREEEGVSPSALQLLWNETCKSLPKVKELSTTRATKCRARLRERSLDQWREVFEKVQNSDFLRGTNARGWKATFDWLIDNDHNAIKVLEGKYDAHKPQTADSLMREVFGG